MNDAAPTPMTVQHDPFAGPELLAFAPISASQREIWLACELDPEVSVGYNEGLLLRLDGVLDVDALRSSLNRLIERHESLRINFSPDGDWLCVLAPFTLDLPVEDLPDADLLREFTQAAMAQPFDLIGGPLLSFRLLRLAAQEHRLLFIAHHAICDGWSGAVVLTELAALYSAAVEGRQAQLPDAPLYTDYAALERDWLASEEGQRHRRYWLEQLQALPPPLDLPSERPRGGQRSFTADRIDLRLPAEQVARLRKLGADHGASLVATLLAGFAALLTRLTGSTDMIIGLAAAGQSLHELPGLVGHCVNLLPLRLRPDPQQPFHTLLRDTRKTVLDAFDHQGVSFGSLLGALPLARDSSRPALIPVVFNVDVRDDDLSHSGLSVGYDTLVRQAENFELYFNLVDNGHDLVIEASYGSALFSADTVRRWVGQYVRLLDAACAQPDQTLAALPLASAATLARVDAWSRGPALPVPQQTLWEAFYAAAVRQPDATAVVCAGQALSYRALAAQALAVAHALQAQGVGPGQLVGVCLERSLRLPVALLGVLASGAGYLPLDPELPDQRLQFMADDADLGLAIVEPATTALLPDTLPRLDLGTPSPPPSRLSLRRPDPLRDPAYAIYTSGTTGQPKGVAIAHASVLNMLAGVQQWTPVQPGSRVAAIATFAFDASVLELFLPLSCGATLVLATREQTLDGAALDGLLDAERVTHAYAAPSAWRLLLGAGWAGHPGLIATSWAEPLPRDLAQALLPRVGQLWNMYGPTETTVIMLGTRVLDADAPITIGQPLANMRAWIVDPEGRLQAPGVTGELWIGGPGVALGYVKRQDLTAERFVADPQVPGERAYRSGDLARWTADGQVECLGRADGQVKLRGYRIELGEIDSLLRQLPELADAACTVAQRGDGDARLVAWVVPADPAVVPDANRLRRALRSQLPGYMVPQQFETLDALPRLASGKLDRRALPDPFAAQPIAQTMTHVTALNAARNDAERDVAQIWASVLGHQAFGIEDRFLDVGGHSLLAVQVAAALQRRYGVRVPLRTVMTESLARLAEEASGDSAGPGLGTSGPALTTPEPMHQGQADSAASPTEQGRPLSRLAKWLKFGA